MPAQPVDPARLLQARVDNQARICVRQNFYTVPARHVTRRRAVRLSASTVELFDGCAPGRGPRPCLRQHGEGLVLDHDLEVLARKPGGLPGATALAQAKASGAFTVTHQTYWDAVRRVRGAGRHSALIEILLAHSSLPAPVLVAAMGRAVATGCLFVGTGYSATTIADIAQRARVSPDTIYATIGRKPALLRELAKQRSPAPTRRPRRPARLRPTYRRDPSARDKIAIYAKSITAIQQRVAPVSWRCAMPLPVTATAPPSGRRSPRAERRTCAVSRRTCAPPATYATTSPTTRSPMSSGA